MFELHPQLASDCVIVGKLKLCLVLLSNDSHYPWLILVPRRQGIKEVFQLEDEEQLQLTRESSAVGAAIMAHYAGDKLNVAALGNMVPQLHIHHIVRFIDDPAWPKPVWGVLASSPYSEQEKHNQLLVLRTLLSPMGLIY